MGFPACKRDALPLNTSKATGVCSGWGIFQHLCNFGGNTETAAQHKPSSQALGFCVLPTFCIFAAVSVVYQAIGAHCIHKSTRQPHFTMLPSPSCTVLLLLNSMTPTNTASCWFSYTSRLSFKPLVFFAQSFLLAVARIPPPLFFFCFLLSFPWLSSNIKPSILPPVFDDQEQRKLHVLRHQ